MHVIVVMNEVDGRKQSWIEVRSQRCNTHLYKASTATRVRLLHFACDAVSLTSNGHWLVSRARCARYHVEWVLLCFRFQLVFPRTRHEKVSPGRFSMKSMDNRCLHITNRSDICAVLTFLHRASSGDASRSHRLTTQEDIRK